MTARLKGMLRSTMVRYMISYTAIVAVLVLGISIFMSNSYTSTIRANTVDSNINKLSKIRSQTEQYMSSMFNIANQISLSPYIKPFRFSETPEQAYHLKKQLVPYTVTNGFINQLFLTFEGDDYLYSSSTSMPLDLFLEDLMRYENTTPEALLAAIRGDSAFTVLPCQNVVSSLLDGLNARMVTVIVPLGMGERQKTGSVLFMVKESTFHQLFADEIYEPRNTYIFHGDDVFVSGTGMDIPAAVVLDAVRDNRATLVQDLWVDGSGYLLIAQSGAKYGMQYATLIPLESVRQSTLRAQIGFLSFLFALGVLCTLLIFYLSSRHVRPIRELRRFVGDSAPGDDDFEAIHSGIEALVDRNEDLHTRLDESLPALRSTFILHFVKGRYRTRQDAVRAAAELGMDIDKQCYLVALVTLPRADSDRFSVESMVALEDGVSGYGAELVSREQFLFVLFADEAETLIAWTERACALGLGSGAEMVSASAAYDDFSRIGGAYLEANATYDNHVVQESASALPPGDKMEAALEQAQAHPVVRDIISYMHEHFSDPNLTMSAIADVYSISAVRLSLDFKEAVGMSPSEYLLRLRMDRAKELLRDADDSIKDVCATVGYYDASGFIRRFKKYMGITPAQYRQSAREEHTEA